jgi:hypothetical protein
MFLVKRRIGRIPRREMLPDGETYAVTNGRIAAMGLLCIEGLPDATNTVRLALMAGAGWLSKQIFAGPRYQRSLEQ